MGASTVVVRAGLAGAIAAAGLLSAGTSLAAAQDSVDGGPTTATSSAPLSSPADTHELEVLAGAYSIKPTEYVDFEGFQCPAGHPYLSSTLYPTPRLGIPAGISVMNGSNGEPPVGATIQVRIAPQTMTYQDGAATGWIHGNSAQNLYAYAQNLQTDPALPPGNVWIIAHCQNIKPA